MTNSDQKCVYRYTGNDGEIIFCAQTMEGANHEADHIFQPPFEITDEAVEAAEDAMQGSLSEIRAGLEAALRVMQKGQDK